MEDQISKTLQHTSNRFRILRVAELFVWGLEDRRAYGVYGSGFRV